MVTRGENVTVHIPLHVVGEPGPGGLLQIELNSLSIEVEATEIPQAIEFDIAGAEIGTQVHASQIPLPSGATLVTEADTIAVLVTDVERSVDTEDAAAEAAVSASQAAASA